MSAPAEYIEEAQLSPYVMQTCHIIVSQWYHVRESDGPQESWGCKML